MLVIQLLRQYYLCSPWTRKGLYLIIMVHVRAGGFRRPFSPRPLRMFTCTGMRPTTPRLTLLVFAQRLQYVNKYITRYLLYEQIYNACETNEWIIVGTFVHMCICNVIHALQPPIRKLDRVVPVLLYPTFIFFFIFLG